MVVLIEALRRLTEPERSRRRALWEQLSKLFVVSTGAPVLEGWSLEELEAVWRNEMWPSYGLTVDLHVKHSLEGYPDREQIEQAWTRCRNAVS